MIFDLNRMHSPQVLAWIIIVAVYGFLEIAIGRRAKTGRKKVHDATFYAVTVPSILGMYGAFFESPLRNHTLPAPWFFSGCAALIAGIILRLVALVQLGNSFSTKVERSEGQRLRTDGIYGVIRHPLYSATLLQVLGTGVMLHSIFALALLPICLAGILIRIRKEERFMVAEFPEYAGYMKKTRRLVPWIF
jgi:protein-S-isoprenylcysteine O-methyltransferase Ste14